MAKGGSGEGTNFFMASYTQKGNSYTTAFLNFYPFCHVLNLVIDPRSVREMLTCQRNSGKKLFMLSENIKCSTTA